MLVARRHDVGWTAAADHTGDHLRRTIYPDSVATGHLFVFIGAAPRAGDEASLVAALRAGDEGAFRNLVKRYHASLVRLARASVASQAVAEEVAQDTWLAVIEGLRGFEGRSSLKTWIFHILVNQARKRGRGSTGPSPGRPGAPTAAVAILRPWTRAVVVSAIEKLSDRQRELVTLRDVEGWTAAEVCELLGLSEGSRRSTSCRRR